MSKTLSNKRADDQAYWAAFLFLHEYWQANRHSYSYDLPNLVGNMQIVGDRIAFDSAYELEWLELTDSKSALSSDETYAAMI